MSTDTLVTSEAALSEERALDAELLSTLVKNLSERGQFIPAHLRAGFRNRTIALLHEDQPDLGMQTYKSICNLESVLANQGAFDIQDEPRKIVDHDEELELRIMRAARTKAWPMGTHNWVRDSAEAAGALLSTSTGVPEEISSKRKMLGKDILLSSATMMSTLPQLKRFEDVIESDDAAFRNHHHSWPHIFLTIEENLNGASLEKWTHKQDAFQMLVVKMLTALEDGHISLEHLTPKHRRMLGLVVPFLAKVEFWQQENSGSWEELTARRSSVMAWDVMAIHHLRKHSQKPGYEFLAQTFAEKQSFLGGDYAGMSFEKAMDALVKMGAQALSDRLPFESPDYPKEDPRYREADAALIYLLELDISQFMASELGMDEKWAKSMEQEILSQVLTLHDHHTGGFKRYSGDSYQGPSFFRQETAKKLSALYERESDDDTGTEHFVGRRAIVPHGREASWTHFSFKLSSWAGRRWLESGEERFRTLQHEQFQNGLRMITGEGEHTIENDENGKPSVTAVPPYQFPECRISDVCPDGTTFTFVSPHTPLRWAQTEAMKAFHAMKMTMQAYTNA